MRRLIIANTYYQLIMALQMRNTLFENDKTVVLLSDHSINMRAVAKKLNGMHIFEQVCYIKSKGVWEKRNKLDKVIDGFKISVGMRNRYQHYLKEISNLRFDEIICFNFAIDIYGLYSCIYEVNQGVTVSLYEEGILSYHMKPIQTRRRHYIDLIRKALKKRALSESIGSFYCLFPEIYEGPMDTVKVPRFTSDTKTARDLQTLFALHNVKEMYQEKYIFFTSVYDFEGGASIGEFDVVCKLAERIGKEKLLVKTHPRDSRDIYVKNSFKVAESSSIPWEAIQLSADFSDKIFITVTSGSALASSLLSEKPTKTFYMYKLCDINNNPSAVQSVESIESLLEKSTMKNVFNNVIIVEDLDEVVYG